MSTLSNFKADLNRAYNNYQRQHPAQHTALALAHQKALALHNFQQVLHQLHTYQLAERA